MINIMHLNHPKTIPHHQSKKKLSSLKTNLWRQKGWGLPS